MHTLVAQYFGKKGKIQDSFWLSCKVPWLKWPALGMEFIHSGKDATNLNFKGPTNFRL